MTFGYVPQRGVIDDIYPLTAFDVVLMGRYPQAGLLRRVTPASRQLVCRYMEQVGIAHLARKPFRSLSGGEKQRTLIARGLAAEADMLVLDEPTDGMDLAGETGIMGLLLEVHRRSGRAILMITHDLNVVANCARQLMIIHGHQDLFIAGQTAELLNGRTLRELYRLPVRVHAFSGRTFIVAQQPSAIERGERPWNG